MAPHHEEHSESIGLVAQRYGVSVETLRRWIRQRVIRYEMVGPLRVRRIQERRDARA